MHAQSQVIKLVVEYKIQGVDFHRHDLLKDFVRKSIPIVIFRGDLEPKVPRQNFDDYIVNLTIREVYE